METPDDQDSKSGLLIKSRVDNLFSRYVTTDPVQELETVSDYFKYIAQRIEHRSLQILAERDLISAFESVSLLLQERLRFYPDSIRMQVDEIIKSSRLGHIMATMANIPLSELKQIQRYQRYGFLMIAMDWLENIFIKSYRRREDIEEFGISVDSLFQAKMALSRLSQIVKYALTSEKNAYDEDFFDLKDHYDPNLVQKPKVIALINILRISIENVSNKSTGKLILERIAHLENEIKKPKPRWGMILAGSLALLGFLADLKTVDPSAYTESYNIISSIVISLYQDGSVIAAKSKTLFLSEKSSQSDGSPDGQPVPLQRDMILPEGGTEEAEKKQKN
jgi:hypothetical protein